MLAQLTAFDMWREALVAIYVALLCVVCAWASIDEPENWGGEWRDEEGCMVFEEDEVDG